MLQNIQRAMHRARKTDGAPGIDGMSVDDISQDLRRHGSDMPAKGAASHLTYCMNVHPGEGWADQVRATQEDVVRVRDGLGWGAPFGLGLRISATAAEELAAAPDRIDQYAELLSGQGLYVFTVNAFPFGTFHGDRVKDEVYRPDWSTRERVRYSLQVADVMARLVPEGVVGSISTAPLTFKGWYLGGVPDVQEALCNLADVAFELRELEERTGRRIVLAMEPEPACYPETTAELIDVMEQLRRVGGGHLALKHRMDAREARELLATFVGCCFDTAHQAVEFENLATSLEALQKSGVAIAKVQVSAAIEANSDNPEALTQLADMQDEVYLHQVAHHVEGEGIRHWSDLPGFLAEAGELPAGLVRVHYHVPLFTEQFGALRSTSSLVRDAAPSLFAASSHIEAETYTWGVWKQATGESLAVCDGLVRELQWLRGLRDG